MLRGAAGDVTVPEPLLGPIQVLVASASRRAAERPVSIYICSDDDLAQARNDFAAVFMRGVSAHTASALLVDCDFLHVGMGGLVPQKDALGFLDFLLYGSSVGVITQETAGGLHVVGAGSFPVAKRMPFADSAFQEAARRLVAHARCVAFVGPLTDGGGGAHPLCSQVDVVAVVRGGDSVVQDVVEEKVAESGADVWSVRFGTAPAEPKRAEAPAREEAVTLPPIPPAPVPAAPRPSVSPARQAREAREARYTSLVPRIAVIVFGALVIAFVAWWMTQPHGTGGRSEPTQSVTRPASNTPASRPTPAPADTLAKQAAPESTRVAPESTQVATAAPPTSTPTAPDTSLQASSPPASHAPTGGTQLIDPDNIHVMAELDQSYKDWFVIHISSFQESIRARQEVAFLESREFPVFIVYLDLGPKGKWYRVYAGPFRTREEAMDVKKNLDAVPQVRFTRIAKIPE